MVGEKYACDTSPPSSLQVCLGDRLCTSRFPHSSKQSVSDKDVPVEVEGFLQS